MDKHNRRVKNMIFNSLEKIYKSAIDISKSFSAKLIPLTLLYTIIEKSKLEPSKEMPSDFVEKYNAMLVTLYSYCQQNATPSKSIYPQLLKSYINILKKSVIDGMAE